MAEPSNYHNRQWQGGWNDPPPNVLTSASDKNRTSVVSRQLRPGARQYPSNPLVSGAGVAGKSEVLAAPAVAYGNQNNAMPHGVYDSSTNNNYQGYNAGYHDQGYQGQGYNQQAGSGQSHADSSNSWSITDYLRSSIEKIDVNAINQTISGWTEKLGSYAYSLPQHYTSKQSQGDLFSANTSTPSYNGQYGSHNNQYGGHNSQFGDPYNDQQGQYNQNNGQYTSQYNTVQSQHDPYTSYAQNPAEYSQHQHVAQQHYEQQMYNQQKYDYDQFAMFRGPEDPAPPPTGGSTMTEPVTSLPGESVDKVELPAPAAEQNFYNPAQYPQQGAQSTGYAADYGAVPSIPTAHPTQIQNNNQYPWQPEYVPYSNAEIVSSAATAHSVSYAPFSSSHSISQYSGEYSQGYQSIAYSTQGVTTTAPITATQADAFLQNYGDNYSYQQYQTEQVIQPQVENYDFPVPQYKEPVLEPVPQPVSVQSVAQPIGQISPVEQAVEQVIEPQPPTVNENVPQAVLDAFTVPHSESFVPQQVSETIPESITPQIATEHVDESLDKSFNSDDPGHGMESSIQDDVLDQPPVSPEDIEFEEKQVSETEQIPDECEPQEEDEAGAVEMDEANAESTEEMDDSPQEESPAEEESCPTEPAPSAPSMFAPVSESGADVLSSTPSTFPSFSSVPPTTTFSSPSLEPASTSLPSSLPGPPPTSLPSSLPGPPPTSLSSSLPGPPPSSFSGPTSTLPPPPSATPPPLTSFAGPPPTALPPFSGPPKFDGLPGRSVSPLTSFSGPPKMSSPFTMTGGPPPMTGGPPPMTGGPPPMTGGPSPMTGGPPPMTGGPPPMTGGPPPMTRGPPQSVNPFRLSGLRSSPLSTSHFTPISTERSSPAPPPSFPPAPQPAELPNSPPTLPTLPVQSNFGGVNIFQPSDVKEEVSEPVPVSSASGWDNDFDTWDDDFQDNSNKDFEDIQL